LSANEKEGYWEGENKNFLNILKLASHFRRAESDDMREDLY